MLAQVEPGELSAKLPASPPEQGEPFADVLRDLDELILPALTHWQHPRFFAYFAVTASEPGILAELLAATLNSVAICGARRRRSTELERRGRSTGSRSSSACPPAGTATSRTPPPRRRSRR